MTEVQRLLKTVWADTDTWLDRQAQEEEVKALLKESSEAGKKAAAPKDPMEELEEAQG